MNQLRNPAILALLCLNCTLISSCNRSKPAGETTGSQDPKTPVELTVLTWGNYLPLEVLARFENQSGIRIVYETIENSEAFAQKLTSERGEYDIVIADDHVLMQLIDQGLILPLDQSLLGNFGNLASDFLGQDFDPENTWSAPYLWGTTLLAYRKDRIPDPATSWNLLWDESTRNHAGLIDEPGDLLLIALMALDHDLKTASPAEIEEAIELLVGHLRDHGGSMQDSLTLLGKLEAGELFVTVAYSGDAVTSSEKDSRIGCFIPDEGAPLWIDSFAISRSSRCPEEAHQFIDFMIEAEAAADTANILRHASPNHAANSLIDKDLLENPTIYPSPEMLEKCRRIRPESSGLETTINRGLLRVYNQARLSRGEVTAANESAAEAKAETDTDAGR